jgi:hypothetical protein
MRPQFDTAFCATLVVHNAVNKIDALDSVALACESVVSDSGTPHPWISLSAHTWIEMEIPKFGEPPPLAIDVYSDVSDDHAKVQALWVLEALESSTVWRVTPDFSVD